MTRRVLRSAMEEGIQAIDWSGGEGYKLKLSKMDMFMARDIIETEMAKRLRKDVIHEDVARGAAGSIIFTSAQALREFFRHLENRGEDGSIAASDLAVAVETDLENVPFQRPRRR